VSSLLNPLGPEPSSVYWIRRGAIVVVALTVIIGLWWLISSLLGGGGSSSDTTPPAGGGGDAASASAEPAQSGDPSTAASSAASEAPAAAVTACPDSVIKVEATTDAATYPVGSTPKLTLTIINTGDVVCKRDVGPKANSLEITSGGYHVWSSDDCNASDKSKVIKMQPGDKVASSITWNGRLSQKGCPNGQGAAAKAGRYALTGSNGGVTSDPTPFGLTAS
jgi:hypothetical protein